MMPCTNIPQMFKHAKVFKNKSLWLVSGMTPTHSICWQLQSYLYYQKTPFRRSQVSSCDIYGTCPSLAHSRSSVSLLYSVPSQSPHLRKDLMSTLWELPGSTAFCAELRRPCTDRLPLPFQGAEGARAADMDSSGHWLTL